VPNKFCTQDQWKGDINVFAALVAAAEREACAKVCEDMARQYDISIDPVEELIACETAAAIRARGQA
jgi:hypothetical protein